MPASENDTDWSLLKKMNLGDKLSFEQIYKKYAAMMYGCILVICKDKHIATTIFKQVFKNLHQASVPFGVRIPFYFWLWKFTGAEAVLFIKNNKQLPQRSEDRHALIDYVCFNKVSRNKVSEIFNLQHNEIGLQLKKELQISN